MKNLLLIIFVLPIYLFAQEPSKGDNTIEVTTDKENIFELAGRQLIERGFEIKDTNKDFGTINTDWKNIPDSPGAYKLNISVYDGKVTIRGKWKNNIGNAIFNAQNQDYDIVYAKGKLNVNSYLWNNMIEIIDVFEGQKRYFKK